AQARQGSIFYFRPALTFPTRSELGFCARLHPKDCIYSSNGPVIVPHEGVELAYLLGLFNSCIIRYLLDSQSHRRSYSPGLIRRINWQECSQAAMAIVRCAALDATFSKAGYYSTDETCPEFALPQGLSLSQPATSLNALSTQAGERVAM